MIERKAYGKGYWYDHMAANDVPLWERFMEKYPDVYEAVAYDVAVGSVPEHAQAPVVAEGASMGRLYQRRIDVVGFKDEETDILEVKPRATMSAIGQVLGYKYLYMRDEGWPKEPKAVIVTDYADADMVAAAQTQGVTIVVV